MYRTIERSARIDFIMSNKLYGSPRSGSAVIEAACAWVGIQVEFINVELSQNAQREASYAAINPQRKLPTLVINGEVLTESLAILLTLDERYPDRGLLPPVASPQRAQVLRWTTFVATELYPLIEIIDYPERFSPSDEMVDATKERALTSWRHRWKLLDSHLAGSPFAWEGGFSALDLYCTVCSRWLLSETFRRTELPRVHSSSQATQNLPQLAKAWARNIGNGQSSHK